MNRALLTLLVSLWKLILFLPRPLHKVFILILGNIIYLMPIKRNKIKTMFLGSKPNPHSKSGTHKNLMAAAISIKPKTIFMVSIQEPEFGSFSRALGNKERATNGAAKIIP